MDEQTLLLKPKLANMFWSTMEIKRRDSYQAICKPRMLVNVYKVPGWHTSLSNAMHQFGIPSAPAGVSTAVHFAVI